MKPQLVKPDTQPEDGLSLRLDKPAKRKSYLVPILIAAAVHVVVIGAFVISLNGKPKAAPKAAQIVAAETKSAVPALRTEPQPVDAPPPAPVAAPVEPAAAPVVPPAVEKPAAKPVVKKTAAKPAKAAVSKKAAKAAPLKTSKAAASKAKAKAVKPKAKPVAKPKPKVPVLDLDKLSKGH